ncbi:MAG: hypothetical protein Aurels2KO_37240 [Aureliella sp.]
MSGESGKIDAPGILDEIDLVQRIVRREDGALSQAILHYGDQVYGLCAAISRDEFDAECVASDVFLELWMRPEAFDSTRGRLKTYLLTLARCRSIDRLRSRVARETNMDKFVGEASHDRSNYAHEETGDASTIGAERKATVDDALLRLPESQRDALQLAFFHGLTHIEVAEKLALPLGTVKSHIRRGLLQLKNELAERVDVGEAL